MTTIVNYRAKEELDDFEVIQSKITANALFNFMREYSYLEKVYLIWPFVRGIILKISVI
ncbi:TPA: hypothetical protein ACGO43_000422 [Streptococcus suis]